MFQLQKNSKSDHIQSLASLLLPVTALVVSLAFVLTGCAPASTGDSGSFSPNNGLVGQDAAETRDMALILNDDYEASQVRLDYISRAKVSLDIQYFIHDMDEYSMAFLHQLRAAARRGVKVRMVLDGMAHSISDAMLKILKDDGVEVREYHPLRLNKLGWISRRMHNKIFLVDGEVLLTGGRNIENSYMGYPGHRDFKDRDILIWLPSVVKEAGQYFEDLWKSKELRQPNTGAFVDEVMKEDCHRRTDLNSRKTCLLRQQYALKNFAETQSELELAPEALAKQGRSLLDTGRNWMKSARRILGGKFLHDPVGKKSDTIGVGPAITEMIKTAQTYVLIETPYLVPSADVELALKEAVARGVQVRILTNSAYSSDTFLVSVAYYTTEQKRLLANGFELYEYKGQDSLHAKSVVVDGRMAFVGSYNLDQISHNKNSEVGVMFDDHEVIEQVQKDIESLMGNSWKIGPDGRPIQLDAGETYPWRPKQNRFVLRILRWLLPLYRSSL